MDILFLITRLLLALVFVTSGIAKLRDIRGSIRAMHEFGMPAPLARLAGTGLPVVEILVAFLLVPPPTVWWGAMGAFLLLLVFSIAISYQLARGRRPECHCFGALDSGPIGGKTLIRNGILSMMALAVAIYRWNDVGPPLMAVTSEISATTPLVLVLSAFTLGVGVFHAWITVAVYQRLSRRMTDLTTEVSATNSRTVRRQMGEILAPIIGEPAPLLELPDLGGNMVDLVTFRGRELFLVFVRPGCWACDALVPTLVRWDQTAPPNAPLLIAISRGTAEENEDLAGMRSPVLLSPNAAVAQAFGVSGTPAAVCLDANGNIASDVGIGIRPVSALLFPNAELVPRDVTDAPLAPLQGKWQHGPVTFARRVVAVLRNASAQM